MSLIMFEWEVMEASGPSDTSGAVFRVDDDVPMVGGGVGGFVRGTKTRRKVFGLVPGRWGA